jgi:hypothetical protein
MVGIQRTVLLLGCWGILFQLAYFSRGSWDGRAQYKRVAVGSIIASLVFCQRHCPGWIYKRVVGDKLYQISVVKSWGFLRSWDDHFLFFLLFIHWFDMAFVVFAFDLLSLLIVSSFLPDSYSTRHLSVFTGLILFFRCGLKPECGLIGRLRDHYAESNDSCASCMARGGPRVTTLGYV